MNSLLVGLPTCLLCGVSKWPSFVRYWLPVITCLALIFSGSGDIFSAQHTSRILAPLIHWLFPSLSGKTVILIVAALRKCAHLAEFGLLAWLLWRARRKPVRNDPRPWRWSEAGWAFGIALLFAITDELHQCFVPSRQGTVRDVLLDAAGAAAALLLLWGIRRGWRKS